MQSINSIETYAYGMDKYLVPINSIETYAYGMDKYLVYKKEEINCYNIIKACKNV